jgi:riboflavin-specific deaminase-like protein
MDFQRLLPKPGSLPLSALLEELSFQTGAPAERPHLIANFIASIDGKATIKGRSGALGDAADRALFHGLRTRVDAVMAGTNTLRIERYGRLIKDPALRQSRVEHGLEPEPIACVVSRSGDVPTDIPLFAEPESRVLVFSPKQLDVPSQRSGHSGPAANVEVVVLDPGELTLTTVMRRLRNDFGVRSLLCEGGPALLGSLIREELVDELFLTLAPKLVSGLGAPNIATGTELPEPETLRLEWVLEREGSLYLRYGFRSNGQTGITLR